MFITRALIVAAAAGLLIRAPAAEAGPERVALAPDYQTRYTLYAKVDRPDRKIVRFMYVDPVGLARARPGAALPDGIVLVMEDRKAKLGPDGQPARDTDGRFIAEDKVEAIFVQQKGRGWGDAYPPETRNGDWEYARFDPTSPPALRPGQTYASCFSCHMSRAQRDYNFTFSVFVADGKK